MDRRTPRVAVAMRPHLSGSAVHAFLSLDPRFDAVLVPSGVDPAEAASRLGADALIASEPVELPGAVVAVLDGSPLSVELHRDGRRRHRPYLGLEALAETLAFELLFPPDPR
ncbi:MAG: hypothetical protein HY658_09870 [Actinobacteria bacterium]|nr:hypothetical protein [Actinomycetota bacterium]